MKIKSKCLGGVDDKLRILFELSDKDINGNVDIQDFKVTHIIGTFSAKLIFAIK